MKQEVRDWTRYNENLVQRGEILLELKMLKDWRKAVDEMNQEALLNNST